MNIAAILSEAFGNAIASSDFATQDGDKGLLHRRRSQRFVACLAQALRNAYSDSSVEVMSMHLWEDGSNSLRQLRTQFGMQELLFDIAVFEKGETTASGGEILSFVRKGLWIVESELAKDSRQALYDFNKLVLGNAANKLFVGPQVAPSERGGYLKVLKAAAVGCEGRLYMALIPHPEAWTNDDKRRPELLAWGDGDWQGDLGPYG